MNKINYLALGAVALTLVSIFSPWVEVSTADNAFDLSESSQPIVIYGISIGYGILGLLVALAGGYMAFKEYKWTFVAGTVNFINGYGYLQGWFGASTHDSGNYGDVTSKSIVDPRFGIYLFILASLAFLFVTLKYYKTKKTETVIPLEPVLTSNLQPAFATAASQVYQPSKIQAMTTSTETPVPSETPKVPVQPIEPATDQPASTPSVPESTVPASPTKPTEAPSAPVQAAVNEPLPVYQAPRVPHTPQPPYVEPQKKKSSTSWILLIILAIVLVGAGVFVMTNNSSQKSKDKTEQSVNDEKARLQIIINEVNQDVSDKKYDDALLKINSINWLYEPDANKGYVDQYNSQRENLRNTIEQQKSNQGMEDQRQATEKANAAPAQPVQANDSVQ